MKFDRQLRTETETSWVVSYGGKTIPRWRTAAILKIVISPYLSEKSSDFDLILYTAADFELDERHVIKNEKVALDRLRVRQNVFLVSLFFFFIISVCPVWWTLSWLHVSFSLHIDPSESNGNYSAASNNIKLVNWPLMGVPLHLVQQGKEWAGPRPAHSPPCCTKCNGQPVNSQRIPITALLYNGPLLCGFNVPIKG